MVYTTGLSVVAGQNAGPPLLWYGELNHWHSSHLSDKMGYGSYAIYNNLDNGRRALVYYGYVSNNDERRAPVAGVSDGVTHLLSYNASSLSIQLIATKRYCPRHGILTLRISKDCACPTSCDDCTTKRCVAQTAR